MPSLKYHSARTKPLAPLGFGSHKLGGVRRIMYEFSNQVKVLHNVTSIDLLAQSAVLFVQTQHFREGMLALPYGPRILFQQPYVSPPLRCMKYLSNSSTRRLI